MARYKPPVEIAMMQAVKRALDPKNLFDPAPGSSAKSGSKRRVRCSRHYSHPPPAGSSWPVPVHLTMCARSRKADAACAFVEVGKRPTCATQQGSAVRVQ